MLLWHLHSEAIIPDPIVCLWHNSMEINQVANKGKCFLLLDFLVRSLISQSF
ncbi:hypothetical protein PN499_24245 [Kamptonema animale CS-326]|uniref:hypothetical protein n=1 Tax=Kamptonema TaxID=1501433 RepID=UPI000349B015|nr:MULTISPECIES: hypothetical protein [Kamptonema]MDB9514315.1 hypothetical protein [Kamptonema animale CS-326]